MSNNSKLNTNNEKVDLALRFSSDADISHYTPVTYTLNHTEFIKTGGIICIGCYSTCIDKTKCDLLEKLIKFVNK